MSITTKEVRLFLFIFCISLLAVIGVLSHTVYGHSWTSNSGHAWGSDDAFISYRYAKNFFDGFGLVFNEGDRVEGYSNFLYTLLIVPGFFFETLPIYFYSVLLNSFFLVVSIVVFYFILEKATANTSWSLIGTALLALNPVIWANAATGLESVFVLSIFLSLWLAVDSKRTPENICLIYFLSLLSILARVDGFIMPIILGVTLWLNNEKRFALKLCVFVVVVMGIYMIARYFYYDDVIANTYYAKVSGDLFQRIESGVAFLIDSSLYNGILPLFLISLFLNIKKLFYIREIKIKFPLVFLILWVAYFIYIGGDIYYERFILSILTIGIFYFVSSVSLIRYKAIGVILVLGVFVSSFLVFLYDGRFEYRIKSYDSWEFVGKELKKFPPDFLLAVDAAGKLPFYSELKTLDMLGLNDRHIGKMSTDNLKFVAAHTKYDPEYVLSQKPDLIATWIFPTLDGGWGLTKYLYEKDYTLKYLVNSSRVNLANNILEVEGLDKVFKSFLIQKNFNYAVLLRKDHEAPSSINAIKPEPTMKWLATELPSQVGKIGANSRLTKGSEGSGFVTYGPYIYLSEGKYSFSLSVEAKQSDSTAPVGYWDIFSSSTGELIMKGEIYGTVGQKIIDNSFIITSELADKPLEIRTFYSGKGELTVHSLSIELKEK